MTATDATRGPWSVVTGDCRDVMRTLPPASVDAIVSDPPYGLSFMGKEWDHGVPQVEFWHEALRVAKPGAHLLAFGGTRTFHRLTVAIEDAGWEIRDCLSWLYGSGFPKSHNGPWGGTALKPAWEPIILARKPLTGTVASNVAQHGTGALNVDGCRIGTEALTYTSRLAKASNERRHEQGTRPSAYDAPELPQTASGRWPANVCLDEEAAAMLGEPSRFFYTAKASRSEREAGLEGGVEKLRRCYSGAADGAIGGNRRAVNVHPTVKPIALMRWLCRLVTPPNGLILDPFTGSGTTGCAAMLEGFRFIGAELSEGYAQIARLRIAHHATQTSLPLSL
jgi:DNA modification methylase